MHSRWAYVFSVSHIPIPSETLPHSRWGSAFLVSHIAIPGEDVYSIVIHPHQECTSSLGMGKNAHPHRELGCASPGIHILTGNGDVANWECTSSPGMEMCLTGNAHPQREWRCVSPGMHILNGNAHPQRECTSWPGMHILTGNAHSVSLFILFWFSLEPLLNLDLYHLDRLCHLTTTLMR